MVVGTVNLACADEPVVEEPQGGNYFVAAYPPFSTWRAERVGAVLDLLERPAPGAVAQPFGLYVHVPFCIQRCPYCYYFSQAGRALEQMETYLAAVRQELELYAGSPLFRGREVRFVYFGGGTPSLLPAEAIRWFLPGLKAVFPWDAVEEVTFECAPRSVTRAKLLELRVAGVNRLSLGIQQLDDEVLRRNGRTHLVADVERAWDDIQAMDFDEVNVDLMVGLVGETDESFATSLERVMAMGPDSITLYQLELPPYTPLARAVRDGAARGELADWSTKRMRLAYAFARLEEAGYLVRSGYAAARNTRHRRFVYQEEQYRGADLLGLGASSFSYVAGAHYQNLVSLDAYLASIRDGRLPISRAYLLDRDERLVREFVLQLKLGRVEASFFRHKFGVDIVARFAAPLERFAARGWLTCDQSGVTLTRAGLLCVDRLLAAFYLPEHQGVRYS